MIIYLDLIFLLNLFYDFLILLSVGIALKRNVKFIRYIFGSVIGALSIFLLFLNINSYILFIIKVFVSILMILVTFKFVTIKYTLNNFLYLYMVSIILAGFLYFLNNTFSLKHEGIIFFTNGFSINYILLIFISPIILFLYIKSCKSFKGKINNFYSLEIVFDEFHFKMLALFDSGNALIDPITKKAVIIVNKKVLKSIYNIRSPVYVPYYTLNNQSLMECFKPSYVIINNKKIYNYLIGVTDKKFSDGIDALLNQKLMEDGYV